MGRADLRRLFKPRGSRVEAIIGLLNSSENRGHRHRNTLICKQLWGRECVLKSLDQYIGDAIKKEIEDKGRRTELVSDIDRANDALKEYNGDLESLSKTLAETSSRYDATQEEFAALITQADARRMQLTRELLDARFALRDKMSAEEWSAMYKRVMEEGSKQ